MKSTSTESITFSHVMIPVFYLFKEGDYLKTEGFKVDENYKVTLFFSICNTSDAKLLESVKQMQDLTEKTCSAKMDIKQIPNNSSFLIPEYVVPKHNQYLKIANGTLQGVDYNFKINNIYTIHNFEDNSQKI